MCDSWVVAVITHSLRCNAKGKNMFPYFRSWIRFVCIFHVLVVERGSTFSQLVVSRYPCVPKGKYIGAHRCCMYSPFDVFPRGLRLSNVWLRGAFHITGCPPGSINASSEHVRPELRGNSSGTDRIKIRPEPCVFIAGPSVFTAGSCLFTAGPSVFNAGPYVVMTWPCIFLSLAL